MESVAGMERLGSESAFAFESLSLLVDVVTDVADEYAGC